jgi:membrane fusion protein, multidrug efflux system
MLSPTTTFYLRHVLNKSFTFLLFGFVLGIITLITACGDQNKNTAAKPDVTFTTPIQKTVPTYLELVGQAQGFEDIEIRARVEGYLQTIDFKEGTFVEKDTLLYTIDPTQLQTDVETLKARYNKTQNDVERLTPLLKKQAVSQQELDNAIAARDAAKAQLENSQLNVDYATIKAPISGIVGVSQVKAGSLVGRGENTLLTTISQVDPIIYQVGLSEAEYLKLTNRDKKNPETKSNIGLVLADGSTYEFPGEFESADRSIDAQTGTLKVKVKFNNPKRILRPGQSGRLRVITDAAEGALLIPQKSVSEIQGTYNVAVVGDDNKVSLRSIKVGSRTDGYWVVTEGLKPNERVVVEGLQRVRDGIEVNAKPYTPPANEKPAQ